MGEIATWSAVKTKVGLGKDSNECPTKAELLALSPTGTGENYVGLEISNASSYGNNETVQLSDIHKVTYRYAFTVVDTVLNFPALGGYSTPRWFGLGTTKQKQIDGVAIGDTISVGYTQSAYPDWIVYDEGYKASENTTLNQRSTSFTFTQNESGKQITVQFTQDAGVETWEYTFSVQNPNLNYTALGGSATPAIAGYNSFKQRYINGKPVGTSVDVGFSSPDLPSWIFMDDENHYTALENKSENSRSQVFTSTQNESGKKVTVTFAQLAGVKTYGTPTVYLGSIADIPASGGTAVTPTYTYSQLWGWNGKTDDGGTISSGASVVWSENISGSNLGTTAKARTKLGSRTLTVTLNGKSGSASIDVYQAENRITNVTQGAWVVSISANPSTFTEQGGTSQISASARASRTNHWSSGATSAASDATGTPTLSIPTASTGFSLSGTTLTVAENTTANQRSVVVRATMDTVYKEVTVTQSAYLVEWVYTMTTTQPTLNFDALGTMQICTITSYREKYINGNKVEGSNEGVNIRIKSTSSEIKSIGSVNIREITMEENETTSSRTGTVVYEQYDSGKTVTITCNQAAGTISQQWVLREVSGFGTIPAAGGQVEATVESGYYGVINGTPKSWHNEAPEVGSTPGWISLTSVQYNNDGYYKVKATGISNGSESGRSGNISLSNSSKTLALSIIQSGASISYNYQFEVTTDFPSVAAAATTPKAVVKSRRYRVVNGVQESSYTLVDLSVYSKPDWTGVLSVATSSSSGAGADKDVTIPVYENTSASIRRGTVVLQQSGSNKQITLNINQSAAVIETRDFIDYVEPVPDGNFSSMEQSITVTVQSYRETIINGTVTSKVAVQPSFTLDQDSPVGWATVALIGGNPSNYEYDYEVSVSENRTISPRHGHVMFSNGTAEVENAWYFTQAEATVSTSYDIYYRRRVNTGSPTSPNIVITDKVTEVELEGTVGSSSFGFVSMELIIEKVQTINGNPQTPVRISSEFVKTNNSVNSVPSGQLTAVLASTSEGDINDAIINIYNTVQNLAEYPRTHTVSFYRKDITLDGVVIGQTPDITVTVNPVPYTRIFIFEWKQEGSITTNITLEGSVYGSSAGNRDIISYASLRRDNVEFAKKYIKPTFIPPSEDWLQVIDNGQNSDNSYNFAFKALTDNEGESARSQSVRFEQPGNGNQSLYAYVSQDPKSVIREELHAELGNYYSYGASDIIPLIYQWYSPDSSDTSNVGDTTPGGYSGVWCNLPATGVINCMITGRPQTGRPMKARLSNIQVRTIDENAYPEVETNQGLSVGYSQQDYKLGIEYSPGMNTYFLITPEILSESGEYGGGIRVNVALRTSYSQIGTTIATITLTPKNPDHPTIYFELIYG